MKTVLKDALHIVHMALISATDGMEDHEMIKIYAALRIVEDVLKK